LQSRLEGHASAFAMASVGSTRLLWLCCCGGARLQSKDELANFDLLALFH